MSKQDVFRITYKCKDQQQQTILNLVDKITRKEALIIIDGLKKSELIESLSCKGWVNFDQYVC